jgi:cold shock CspA family protein
MPTRRISVVRAGNYLRTYFLIAMQEGTIASIVDQKNFGFIKIEGREKDLFFHANELVNVQIGDLQKGDKVTFEEGVGQKGPMATKVSRV